VVVIEASQLLGSFDRRLRQYAANKLIKSGVTLRRGMVKEAFKDHVVLQVPATPCMLPLQHCTQQRCSACTRLAMRTKADAAAVAEAF
jgi:NADH dehydrogenase FAD-containing subunit